MSYTITYKPIRHGYVRLGADGVLRITIPRKLQNDQNFLKTLITKGEQLRSKHVAKESIVPITKSHITLRGEDINISEFSSNNPKTIKQELEKILIDSAIVFLDKYAKLLGVKYASLSIKTYKARRGSCSYYNDILLNRSLVHLDPIFLEYVCCHEICHIKQKNHSARFRSLVSNLFPAYLQVRRDFRKIKIN